MDAVTILKSAVPYRFLVGASPANAAIDRDALRGELAAMAAAVNAVAWAPPLADAFAAMRAITVFVGAVPFGQAMLQRPFTDQATADFYWQADEFAQEWTPAYRATYFLHDCWHVIQYQRDGGSAKTVDEMVQREVEAVDMQIAAARNLACDDQFINFLTNYRNNDAAIRERLQSGYEPGAVCTACGTTKQA